MHRVIFRLHLLLGLALAFALPAQASMMSADQAFAVSSQLDGGQLHMDVHIDDCCYLYQQRFAFKSEQVQLGAAHFDHPASIKQDPDLGAVPVFHHQVQIDVPVQGQGQVVFTWQGCNERLGICYPPQQKRLTISRPGARPWSRLLPFYLGGLGLAFTPCVLPMIPILAGLLASGQRRRERLLATVAYVLGSASSYALLGGGFALLGHSLNVAAWFAQPLWHIGMALIFVMLALSLFDIYQLALPASLAQTLDGWSRRQQAGSVVGAYIMGALAALIVSPCVSAPMAGALIYVTQLGEVFWGALLLFVLGLGLGTPLLILGWGESRLLPKAGPWMHAVRAVFGVGMLVVALQLLQPLLLPLYFMLACALLALGCASALGAFDSAAAGWPRLWKSLGILLALLAAAWTFGALAGGQDLEHPWPAAHPASAAASLPRSSVNSPMQLQQALLAARGQKVMLDVWASWCISCRHFEHEVLDQAEVQEALQGMQLIRVDVSAAGPDSDALLQELHIPGPPAVFFVDRQGQFSGAPVLGEVSPQAFLHTLRGLAP